jgi:glycosyltransferase involved in cell wall biosynthesis
MKKSLIAIPNFNNKQYICEAIRSALNQKLENLDVVIFDNNSTDGVMDLVGEEFGSTVRKFVNAINVGAIRNHNLCLDYAEKNNYDYVRLLSSDDILKPYALTEAISLLEKNPSASIAISNMTVVDEELNFVEDVYFAGHENPGTLTYGNTYTKKSAKALKNFFGGPSGITVRVSSLKGLRFDTSYEWISDLNFSAEITKNNWFINSGEIELYYRRHQNTDSKRLSKKPTAKTFEFLRFSLRYGGGIKGVLKSVLLLLRYLLEKHQ